MYFIKCQNHYIGLDNNNRPTKVAGIRTALGFNEIIKAQNHIKSLPKIYTSPQIEEIDCEVELIKGNKRYRDKKFAIDLDLNEISTLINEQSIKLNLYREQKSIELQECDLIENDIKHKIEFTDFNASQGYYLCKLQQDNLRKRREIKNKKEQCELLLNISVSQYNNIDIKTRMKTIITRKKYTPRVLTKLFESNK